MATRTHTSSRRGGRQSWRRDGILVQIVTGRRRFQRSRFPQRALGDYALKPHNYRRLAGTELSRHSGRPNPLVLFDEVIWNSRTGGLIQPAAMLKSVGKRFSSPSQSQEYPPVREHGIQWIGRGQRSMDCENEHKRTTRAFHRRKPRTRTQGRIPGHTQKFSCVIGHGSQAALRNFHSYLLVVEVQARRQT